MKAIEKIMLIFLLLFSFKANTQRIPHDTIIKIVKFGKTEIFSKVLDYKSALTGQNKPEMLREIFFQLDTCEVIDFYVFLKKANYKIPVNSFSNPILFRYACMCGRLEVVKALLADNKNLAKDFLTLDNFFAACQSGNLELVKYLVKIGSPYQKPNKFNESVIMAAVDGGSLAIVKYLVDELGLNPDQLDILDERPISVSIRHGMLQITQFLFNKRKVEYEEKFIQNLFRTSAYFNDAKTFEFLKENMKLDPCSKDIFAHNIYLDAVRHCGIDTNFFNILPNNPCMNDVDTLGENIAFKCSYDSVTFKFLLSKGVDYSIYNRNGYTPAAKFVNEMVSSVGVFEELTGSDLLSIQQDILNQIYCMAKMGVSANGEDPIFYLFRHLSDNNISITSYLLKANLISGSYQNKEGINLLKFLEDKGKLKLIRLIKGE
jgi:ankyrin repeat protein